MTSSPASAPAVAPRPGRGDLALLVALGLVGGAAGQAPPTKEVEALAAEAAAG